MNDYSSTYTSPVVTSSNPVASLIGLIVFVVLYVYLAYSIMVMARKTNTPNAWMAWIPILNVYLLIKIAGKPGWWIILFFIPIVNIIFAFIVWYNAALRLRKPGWLGIVVAIIPLLVGFLAFSEGSAPASGTPPMVQ